MQAGDHRFCPPNGRVESAPAKTYPRRSQESLLRIPHLPRMLLPTKEMTMSDETLRDTILTELRVARSDFELTDEPGGTLYEHLADQVANLLEALGYVQVADAVTARKLDELPSGSHVTRKTFGHDAGWVKMRSGDWKMEDTGAILTSAKLIAGPRITIDSIPDYSL